MPTNSHTLALWSKLARGGYKRASRRIALIERLLASSRFYFRAEDVAEPNEPLADLRAELRDLRRCGAINFDDTHQAFYIPQNNLLPLALLCLAVAEPPLQAIDGALSLLPYSRRIQDKLAETAAIHAILDLIERNIAAASRQQLSLVELADSAALVVARLKELAADSSIDSVTLLRTRNVLTQLSELIKAKAVTRNRNKASTEIDVGGLPTHILARSLPMEALAILPARPLVVPDVSATVAAYYSVCGRSFGAERAGAAADRADEVERLDERGAKIEQTRTWLSSALRSATERRETAQQLSFMIFAQPSWEDALITQRLLAWERESIPWCAKPTLVAIRSGDDENWLASELSPTV